ncbi:MAG: twin transmembrane helix small protein [Pseudomonadota bacterium]
MNPIFILIIIMALLTAGVLIRGIVMMARGDAGDAAKSNKLMQRRVLFQGIAVALIVLLLFTLGRAG